MSEEYVIQVNEAIRMYRCLATMRLGNVEISINSEFSFNLEFNQYQFSIKGTGGKYALTDYDALCIVTFKDYTATILDFTARQLMISTWLAKHLAAKLFNKALAKEKLEWEASLKSLSEDTQKIVIIDSEEDTEEE